MTENEEKPVNGQNHGGKDSEDEEDPSKMRPVHIEQDMREMERRKRVEVIMNSKLFREELERAVNESFRDYGADGLSSALAGMRMKGSQGAAAVIRTSSSVVPINDIRGFDGMGYAKDEKQLRCKLAAVYRLVDTFGWSQSIYNHISLRISQDNEHFLINPYGVLYSEITASSLVKVNLQGKVIDPGTTNFGVNAAGFMLHAAIHSARPELKCVLHLRHPSVVAISATKCGLLPLSQDACLLGEISYHQYQGPATTPEQRDTIAKDLGAQSKTMMMTNHGALCCGQTLEEAFFYAKHLVTACDTQLEMMPLGIENLALIDDATRQRVYETCQQRGGIGVTAKKDDEQTKEMAWGVGEMEFEAHMRMLDSAGFRTGYQYRNPLVREELIKPDSEVELPPSLSSLGHLLEEEGSYKDGPLRSLLSAYAKQATKEAGRTRWMNSPSVLETGTPEPKKTEVKT